jgi:hypothetical protein
VIAGPARQKLNCMPQLEPISSGEIDPELGDDLTLKPRTLGRLPDVEVLTRAKAMGFQIRHAFR